MSDLTTRHQHGTSARPAGVLTRAVRLRLRRTHLTRRGLQAALGLLWLADGVLQLQPVMLSTRFGQRP